MKNLSQLKQLSSCLSVLYIEDDLQLQNTLCPHLKKLFSKVYQAFDGKEGIRKYLLHKPDIIITDLTLSKQNSFAMIMQIQDIDENINIIVLSHKDDNFELLESLDIHNIQLLSKPLDFTILYTTLTTVLFENFQTQEYKQCKLLINEIIKNREPILCLNNYKGIVLSHFANLLFYENDILKIQVTQAQLVAALHEKAMVIEYKNRYISCQLIDINRTTLIVTLTIPTLIQYHKRSPSNKRIDTDKSFRVSLSTHNINFEVQSLNISYNFITILHQEKIAFQKDDMVNLSIGFEINAPSSLIKEKKFSKIFAKGQIVRIDTLENGQKITLKLLITKSGESVFKRYLQQREIEIIREFKSKIQSNKEHG